MKTRHLVGLALLTPAALCAQAAPPVKSTEPDPIVLSPFIVDTSADTGYQATSTLAGSRLKTELKDIAASVTVLTNEFMDDLGATNIVSALAFVAGAETDATTDPTSVSSNGQGYLGGDFGDVNNRSDEVRVRGLGRASSTLNFIQTIGTSDRYNTERAEFLRGANSVLFGLAEPAGLINSSSKVAKLYKNQTTLDTKFDNFGSARVVLDVNRVLVKDRLSLRAVGLETNTRYEVKNAFYHDRRMFLTGTYQPFKTTTVRVNYEAQNLRGMRPNFRTVQDNVSEWLNAYNQYARVLTPAQIAAAFYWDPTVPAPTTGAPLSTTFTTTDGRTANLGFLRRPLDGNANATALFHSGNGNGSGALDNALTLLSNRTLTGGATNGVARQVFIRSAGSTENTALFADPQVTNKRIFPYNTVELGAMPGEYRNENDHKITASLDQRITADFFLSAYFQQEVWNENQMFNPIAQTSNERVVCAVATAISANSLSVGSGCTAQSAKTKIPEINNAADAIAEAMADSDDAQPERESRMHQNYCYRHGEPCSNAKRAVMADPEYSAPSITRTPWASPLTMRFRIGKFCGYGGEAMGNSLTTKPDFEISACSFRFSAG